MTIRNRLTLSFSVVVLTILLAFACTVYAFSSLYRKSEFNNRLKQRIEITEKIFLENIGSSDDLHKIQEQFLNKLPEETEEVVEVTSTFKAALKHEYPELFMDDLLSTREAFFQDDKRQGGGKIFHINNKDYLVLLTAVDNVGNRMMSHLITVIVVVMVICGLIMILLSHILSGMLLNPIISKIKQANAISANNLYERLAVTNASDEMAQLAIAFNKLLDRVEQAFNVQKLFIDNASHEIRNPLTAIMGEAEYALGRPRNTEAYIDSLTSITHEAERLNTLVNDLLQLAGISHKDISFGGESIPVIELLMAAKEKLNAQYPQNQVHLGTLEAGQAALCVAGNRHLLTTAFFNLMDNGSKYSSFKPVVVTISTRVSPWLEIRFRDEGIGIPDDDLKNITVPFHRAANVRQIKGTGIGIPLTVKIIELHGGTLEVKSQLNAGTVATVILPRVSLKS